MSDYVLVFDPRSPAASEAAGNPDPDEDKLGGFVIECDSMFAQPFSTDVKRCGINEIEDSLAPQDAQTVFEEQVLRIEDNLSTQDSQPPHTHSGPAGTDAGGQLSLLSQELQGDTSEEVFRVINSVECHTKDDEENEKENIGHPIILAQEDEKQMDAVDASETQPAPVLFDYFLTNELHSVAFDNSGGDFVLNQSPTVLANARKRLQEMLDIDASILKDFYWNPDNTTNVVMDTSDLCAYGSKKHIDMLTSMLDASEPSCEASCEASPEGGQKTCGQETCKNWNVMVEPDMAADRMCKIGMKGPEKMRQKEKIMRAIKEKDMRFKMCRCKKWSWWWRSDYFHKNPGFTKFQKEVYIRTRVHRKMREWGLFD